MYSLCAIPGILNFDDYLQPHISRRFQRLKKDIKLGMVFKNHKSNKLWQGYTFHSHMSDISYIARYKIEKILSTSVETKKVIFTIYSSYRRVFTSVDLG